MEVRETTTIEVDGSPVVFELRPTGREGALQLWANGRMIGPGNHSLAELGRAGLVGLYRKAARAGKVVRANPVKEPYSVKISEVRAYLYVPRPDEELATIMLYRLDDAGWRCDLCETEACEHVELFLRQQEGR